MSFFINYKKYILTSEIYFILYRNMNDFEFKVLTVIDALSLYAATYKLKMKELDNFVKNMLDVPKD